MYWLSFIFSNHTSTPNITSSRQVSFEAVKLVQSTDAGPMYRSIRYSPSLWHGFCPVKRTSKYFATKWSEQKVVGIEVVGLYIIPISSGQWFWNRIHFRTENGFCERNYNYKEVIFGSKINSVPKSLTRWNGYYISSFLENITSASLDLMERRNCLFGV